MWCTSTNPLKDICLKLSNCGTLYFQRNRERERERESESERERQSERERVCVCEKIHGSTDHRHRRKQLLTDNKDVNCRRFTKTNT